MTTGRKPPASAPIGLSRKDRVADLERRTRDLFARAAAPDAPAELRAGAAAVRTFLAELGVALPLSVSETGRDHREGRPADVARPTWRVADVAELLLAGELPAAELQRLQVELLEQLDHEVAAARAALERTRVPPADLERTEAGLQHVADLAALLRDAIRLERRRLAGSHVSLLPRQPATPESR